MRIDETRNFKKNKIFHHIEVTAGCIDDCNRLWFCPMGFNSLFCFDLSSDRLMWKGFFPEESIWKPFLYMKSIIWNNKIVFAPYNADNIMIYDIELRVFEKIEVGERTVSGKYYNMSIYKDKVILFGDHLDHVLFLDMQTKRIEKKQLFYGEINGAHNCDFYIARNLVLYDEVNCYLVGTKTNALIRLNMSDLSYEIYRLGDDNGVFANLIFVDGELYLIPGKNRYLSVWNIERGVLEEIEGGFSNGDYHFAFCLNGEVKILSNKSNNVLTVSKNKELNRIQNDLFPEPDLCEEETSISRYSFLQESDNYLVCYRRTDRTLLKYNKETNMCKAIDLYMDEGIRSEMVEGLLSANNNLIFESPIISVTDYIYKQVVD